MEKEVGGGGRGGEKRGKEGREREGKTKGKKNRGKETQRDKEGGWQEGVRDREGTADTQASAGHLEAQDRRKQAAGTEERERARNKVSPSWGEWGYGESTGHGEAGRKRVQERGRRQLASRERADRGWTTAVEEWAQRDRASVLVWGVVSGTGSRRSESVLVWGV